MAEVNDTYESGYRKPPKHTQFVKGHSGNPKGRPRGSQNPATILNKVCRERIRVTVNGRSRSITKFEATMLQLMNKSASGDLKAIRELLSWLIALPDFEQATAPQPIAHESDRPVIANILKRIRHSEDPPNENDRAPAVTDSSGKEV